MKIATDAWDSLANTDWRVLFKQKQALVRYLNSGQPIDADLAEGLISFLDAVQDEAQERGYFRKEYGSNADQSYRFYNGSYEVFLCNDVPRFGEPPSYPPLYEVRVYNRLLGREEVRFGKKGYTLEKAKKYISRLARLINIVNVKEKVA